MPKSVERKSVNALIPDAELSLAGKSFLHATHAKGGALFMGALKKGLGGLWVRGTVTLDEECLRFQPNIVNRIALDGTSTVDIPLGTITEVRLRPGFVTKIIDVVAGDGMLTFRCYGAEQFAERIRACSLGG